MSDEPEVQPEVQKPRSKSIYVMWGVALAVLLTLGLFCWLVVVPVWRVRRLIDEYDRIVTAQSVLDRASMAKEGPFVARAIEDMGGRGAAVQRLRLYLRMPDFLTPRKRYAVHLLSACWDESMDELFKCLEHEDARVREAAVYCLGWEDDLRVVDPLMEALNDSSPRVRQWAARALGRRSDARIVDALQSALTDENPQVRQEAEDALDNIRQARKKGEEQRE